MKSIEGSVCFDKIAGCVVLYNPCISEVLENIDSYIDEVDLLFVVLNSSDETTIIRERYNNVVFINNPFNYGIAKALNQGAELAMSKGFGWLLTMDQDSSFYDNTFFLSFRSSDKTKVAIFSPSHEIIKKDIEAGESEFKEECTLVMTSGNLLNLNAWKELGGFNEKLFIDEVDNDFCLRAKDAGFKLYVFKYIYLKHKLGDLKEVLLFGRKICLFQHSPVRTYYIFRNNLYLFSEYFARFPFVVIERMKELLKEFLRILLFQNQRRVHFRFMAKGIVDYFRNKFGMING